MNDTLIEYSKGFGYINNILHNKFDFQTFGIENIMSMSSDSWGNTVAVLQIIKKIFLDNPTTFIEFEIVVTILWSLFLLLIFTKFKDELKITQLIFLEFSFVILNVYTFTVTKELVQILYFVAIYFILTSKKLEIKTKYICVFAMLILAVITFRVYYVLMIYFVVAYLIISKINIKKNILVLFFGMSGAYFVFLLGLYIFSRKYYGIFCFEMLFADLDELGANTYIHNIIAQNDSNILLVFAEYIMAVIRLSFPVELVFLGIKYIPYVVFQSFSSIFIIKSFKKNNRVINIALMLYFAFLFMSASFEVDFGTWLRHQTVIYPILFIVVDIVKIDKNKEEKFEKD